MNMKRIIFLIFAASIISFFAASTNAQMTGGFSNTAPDWEEVVEHTTREEKEGQTLWEKFQAKEVVCTNLDDEQFGILGEYFMGKMMGNSHTAMNAMMIEAHGEKGEEQIHIVMGKRLSGCDTSAVASEISGGWMGMMNMMTGSWSPSFGFNRGNNSMMNLGLTSMGGFGWIFMVLWWILIIAGIVALIKWLMSQSRGSDSREKSALEILKERYAKGEIDKKEFEERKKDLI